LNLVNSNLWFKSAECGVRSAECFKSGMCRVRSWGIVSECLYI